jgi:hypothetical protein
VKIARVVQAVTEVTSSDAMLQTSASSESSQPREYGVIAYGTTNHYFCFADRDMVVSGIVYPAIAGARGELAPAGVGKPTEMVLTLPIDHAFCRRYTANVVPPKVITCTLSRQDGANTEQIWTGNITSMSVDDDCTEASFRVRSRAAEQLLRVLPTVTAGRMCPLVWGLSSLCGVDPDGTGPTGLPHKIVTTVLSVNGREVHATLAAIPAADPLRDNWATNGYLKHVPSGEIFTILKHEDPSPGVSTLAYLTLDAVVFGMNLGDSIEVYAGCPRIITTCNAKFANKKHFGGFPQLPTKNPIVPFGVTEP